MGFRGAPGVVILAGKLFTFLVIWRQELLLVKMLVSQIFVRRTDKAILPILTPMLPILTFWEWSGKNFRKFCQILQKMCPPGNDPRFRCIVNDSKMS